MTVIFIIIYGLKNGSLCIISQVTGEPLIRRSDDTAEALHKRLQVYHKQTQPLVDYYKKRGLHTWIDATLNADKVFENIKRTFINAKSKDKVLFYG